MKFRIAPKDLVIFIIFCIFLFYLCAIAVLNFSSFATTGTFYGLNPIEAFSASYLPITIIMFAIVLIIIFASVSSYIFDKEKGSGVGLSVKKKEENEYSRFATDKEMKNAFGVKKINISDENTDAAGVVLMMNKKEWYVDNSENHTLVVGATASGKTTSVVDPLVVSLSKKGESMVLTDPKGEIYKNHAAMLREKGYNVIVLNFRDPVRGSSWNPLTLPYQLYKDGNVDKATELLEDVSNNILKEKNNNADPFWQNSAADYFSGCVLGLFENGKEEEVNINSIYTMTIQGEERFATSTYIKEYFTMKGESSTPYVYAANVINAPKETQGGQLSTFRQKIRQFAAQKNLSEMLCYTDFDMRNIGKEKSAVFIVIQDEKTTYHGLATIFIKQLYETLIDEAYKQANGRLKYRTNFILDEFANMPPLKDVTSMVTAARSRDIRFTFIIQNFAQLNDVYGENDAQTIRSNCGNLIYLLTTELKALEEISKLCGVKKPKDKDKAVSEKPLVSVTDLQKMKMNEVIILKARMNPFKTKLVPSYNQEGMKKYEKSEFYTRPVRTVKIFDIKEFVKEEKRRKMTEEMEKNGGKDSNPMNGGMFGMPGGFPPSMGGMPNFNPMGMPNMGGIPNKTPMDIDAMIKDIDAQIAKLEKEEEEKRKEVEKAKAQDNKMKLPEIKAEYDNNVKIPDLQIPQKEIPTMNIKDKKENIIDLPSIDLKALEEKSTTEIEEKTKEDIPEQTQIHHVDEPKINVDNDSVIVDEHVVSDDEFFDDFFGDD